jgi:hypothetical protein
MARVHRYLRARRISPVQVLCWPTQHIVPPDCTEMRVSIGLDCNEGVKTWVFYGFRSVPD